ncbi:MAG: beta-galactosidase [Bacteroidales bacterium]|nr:beta-galactosidase [Bacteroidales bacterium]
MNRILWIGLLLIFTIQTKAQNFFKPEKMVETGVYYYPEAWNPDQWDRDFKKMADMGFEFTHIAEFAWAQIEPTEGQFDFKWLDKAVELAAKYNLKVIIGTPSAAPPVWLVRKYPEVLIEMSSGQTGQLGTRQYCSWSNPKYRELTTKLVAAMAKHFGNDKRIWGWQIDNEPSHYGTYDFSPSAQSNFRKWLKKKYETVDKLNNAWGTAFWSGIYTDFSQIEIPNVQRLVSGAGSPISLVDFKRFSADECAEFISMQYHILHESISKSQFVTTNYMHLHTDVDPWRNKDLDFISYTMYPVAGYTKGIGDQGFRLGDPWRISYANDFFRPLKGVTGVMELQPGQVNWGYYNPLPYPGAVRAWLWNSFAGGLNFICSYRFRQPLFGSEQFHYGMVGTDGVTELSGGQEYRQFMKEIRELRKFYKPNMPMPTEYAARKTALLYNPDNLWETEVQKQTYQWDEIGLITRYYSALKTLCIPVDIIGEDRDLSTYPVVIAPAYQMVDRELIEKWRKYVENGGQLILTCRTGLKDRNGHLFEAPWADAITSLIGAKISMYDELSKETKAEVAFNGQKYLWSIWGDILEPYSGTETWATYANQFYAGKSSVVHRNLGKGSVTYIGVNTENGKLEKEILKKTYDVAHISTNEQPEGVMVNWRDGFWVSINYSSTKVNISIPKDAKIILGSQELDIAGVAVWLDLSAEAHPN